MNDQKFAKWSVSVLILVSICMMGLCAVFAAANLIIGYQLTDTTCVITSVPEVQNITYVRPNCNGMPPYDDFIEYFAFANVNYLACGRVYKGILQISESAREFAHNSSIGDAGACHLQDGFPYLIPGNDRRWYLSFGYAFVGVAVFYFITMILWFIARIRMGCRKNTYEPI